MNTILQKRIEEKSKELGQMFFPDNMNVFARPNWEAGYIETACKEIVNFALQNQWISVEEALPEENRIIAKLSKSFCNKDDCYEILNRIKKEYIDLRHPDGYYDLCGENVPTSAITHWIPIPSLEGGEK